MCEAARRCIQGEVPTDFDSNPFDNRCLAHLWPFSSFLIWPLSAFSFRPSWGTTTVITSGTKCLHSPILLPEQLYSSCSSPLRHCLLIELLGSNHILTRIACLVNCCLYNERLSYLIFFFHQEKAKQVCDFFDPQPTRCWWRVFSTSAPRNNILQTMADIKNLNLLIYNKSFQVWTFKSLLEALSVFFSSNFYVLSTLLCSSDLEIRAETSLRIKSCFIHQHSLQNSINYHNMHEDLNYRAIN